MPSYWRAVSMSAPRASFSITRTRGSERGSRKRRLAIARLLQYLATGEPQAIEAAAQSLRKLADRLGRRDTRWYLWLPAAASVGAIPFVVAFLLWPDPAQAFWLVVPGAFLNSMWVGTYNAVVQSLAKPRMRAMASAVNTLISTGLIGQGLGPLLVGILSDRLEPSYGKDALRVALAVAVFAHLWGAIHSVLASRTLRADQRARQA